MKVLLVAYLERPEATANLILRALHALSLNVEVFSYREMTFRYSAIKMNFALIRKLREYSWRDLVIIIKGEGIEPKILTVSQCRKVLWYFDFNAHMLPNELIEIGRVLSAIFLACYPWIDELRDQGIQAFFLPQATDPFIYHPTKPDKDFQCDVAFIGTNKPGRTEVLSRIAKHFDLKVFGEQWRGTGFRPGKPAYLNDFNKVCNSARVIVNITPSTDWPIYPLTFSQRVYMVLSSGGFLLNDSIPGMHRFFEPGKELVFYDNVDDLLKKIEHYLAHDDERIKIAKRGRNRILKEHTYQHRIKEMFTCLGLLPSVLKSIRV